MPTAALPVAIPNEPQASIIDRSLAPVDIMNRTIAILLLVMFFAGCGQSGPLFIPGDPSTIQTPPQQQSTSEEDEDEEDESGAP